MVFGPTNVAVHRVSMAVELGRISDALDMVDLFRLTSGRGL
jgi:hypothetical protein